MTGVFDVVLLPFRGFAPITGLLAVSLVFGVFMILVFKYTSNQGAIGRLRTRMGSRALGMLLHLHSPAAVLRTAASLMGDNFVYLWMILRPMLVITVPFIITAAQLDARYGRLPIPNHPPATVTVTWSELPQRETLELRAGGLVIIEPVVFVDTLMQTSFRVQSGTPGGFVAINTDTFPAGASNPGSGSVVYRGASRRNLPQNLLLPFHGTIGDGSSIAELEIHLPETRFAVLGGRWSWLAVFLTASSLSAIAGAVVFRVKL